MFKLDSTVCYLYAMTSLSLQLLLCLFPFCCFDYSFSMLLFSTVHVPFTWHPFPVRLFRFLYLICLMFLGFLLFLWTYLTEQWSTFCIKFMPFDIFLYKYLSCFLLMRNKQSISFHPVPSASYLHRFPLSTLCVPSLSLSLFLSCLSLFFFCLIGFASCMICRCADLVISLADSARETCLPSARMSIRKTCRPQLAHSPRFSSNRCRAVRPTFRPRRPPVRPGPCRRAGRYRPAPHRPPVARSCR